MHWKVFGAAAAALCVVMIVDMQAATGAGRDIRERLTQSAYFSDACRQEAQALGIAPAPDANELLTAFAAVARQVFAQLSPPAPAARTWKIATAGCRWCC